jgi:pyrroline-5-carboxylate reductase
VILLSPRNAEKAAALAADFPDHVRVCASNAEVVDGSDWVIMATPPKPELTEATYRPLNFRANHNVCCLIAGINAETLRELVAPATSVTQSFPLPPAEHGESTSVMFPPHPPTEVMLAKLGRVVPCPDFEQAMTVGVMG